MNGCSEDERCGAMRCDEAGIIRYVAEMASLDEEVHDASQHRADDDPEEHVPVEERNAVPRWQRRGCVKRHPQGGNKGDEEQDVPCLLPLAAGCWPVSHSVAPF